ncbi:hypothetical protein LTR56_017727 [Elasticomyces elasticus]|nr:hypothetical protein LTR56_017727 [Elasticomyces elasticus]KAK3637737.1 hypothetical protein LTR22_018138 [Elasticomyces elasticus]KAK4915365.1 hypothetical protein LTR49_016496 [Elasticomyces elasticus]KAK5752269.1 hypothetical protein LTS12_017663 [Elasticomyces elasticus]
MSSEIACDPPAPDTCNWIFYDQQYISWAKAGGTFSIVGRAGCGKSTLMQHIVKLEISLQEMAVEIGRHEPYPQLEILCFCFCGTQEEPELDMLRSLLHQMLCDNPDLLARFVAISGFERRCRNRGGHGSKWDWTVSELRDYFASLVKYAKQRHHVIRIFLDGVDERVADVCRRLTGFLSAKPAKSDSVHGICYSCRPNSNVDIRYVFRIDLEAHNRNDIALYVFTQFAAAVKSGQLERERLALHGNYMMSAPVLRDAVCLEDGRRYSSAEGLKNSEYWCDDANVYADRVTSLTRGLVDRKELGIDLNDGTTRVLQILMFDHDSVGEFMLEAGLRMLEEKLPRHLLGTPLAKLESSIAGKCLSYLICSRSSESVYSDVAKEKQKYGSTADDDVSRLSSFDEDPVPVLDLTRLMPCTFQLYAHVSWRHHLEAAEKAHDLTGVVEVLDRIRSDDWSLVVPGAPTLLHILCGGKLDRTLSFLLDVERHHNENEPSYDTLRKRCRSELNAQTAEGLTPMAIAAACGRCRAVEVLAEHGAEPNIPDAEGWTPLHLAAEKGHEPVVRALLLCRGVNVDAKNKQDVMPLYMAIIANHLAIADLLLRASSFGAHCGEISVHEDGHHTTNTPLLCAFRWGSKAMLTLLLTCSKIDKRLQGEYGRSLLHTLVLYNHHAGYDDYKDRLHMLIHSGKLDLNVEDEDGRSVLFYACMYGDACAVQSLLFSKEVNLGTRARGGETALEIAIKMKRTNIVKLFVEAKAGLNIKCDHDHDDSMAPLALAADRGRADIVKLLLSSSTVDIRAWDDTKSTALSRAVKRGRTACVELLLEADGVCCRECCGRTLLTAIDGGYIDLVQTLVRATSKEFGHLETVDIMLQHRIVVGSGTAPWSTSVLANADKDRLRPDGSTDVLAARQQITQYLEKYVSNVRAVYGNPAPQRSDRIQLS